MKKNLSRRGFLRAAAAGAGLVSAPAVSGPADSSQTAPKKTDDLNVALIGVGLQGTVLLESSLKIPGVRFRAVCDIWEAYNLKRASGRLQSYGQDHHAYTDYRDLLEKEKDLDAVLIATPDFVHAEHTIACLEAGLDVYCEKVMSNTLDGARAMVRAARETGKLLQIGHQRRSNPKYLHCARNLLRDARIAGRLTAVNGQWNRSVQQPISWPRNAELDAETLARYGFKTMQQFRNWRWYKGLGGGPIMDLGSHQIDVFNWFLGTAPKSVVAEGGAGYYDPKTHEWPDTVMAIYEYERPEGTVQAFYQTIGTNSCQAYFETFMGDEGTLVISEADGRSAVYREPATLADWGKWVNLGFLSAPPAPPKPAEENEGEAPVADVRETVPLARFSLPENLHGPYHQPHLENFFNAVRGEAKLNCPAETAYATEVTVLKVNEAMEAGRRLFFKPEEFEA